MSNPSRRYPGVRFLSVLLLLFAVLSLGCASYSGSARSAQPSSLARERSWVMVPGFPLVLQEHQKDCGAAALAAVLQFWGVPAEPPAIEAAAGQKGQRLRAGEIEHYARSQGLSAFVFYGTMADIFYEVRRGRPVIVGLGKPLEGDKALAHYQVVVGFEPKKKQVLMLDPAKGWQIDSFEGFAREWSASKAVTIVAFVPSAGAHTASR